MPPCDELAGAAAWRRHDRFAPMPPGDGCRDRGRSKGHGDGRGRGCRRSNVPPAFDIRRSPARALSGPRYLRRVGRIAPAALRSGLTPGVALPPERWPNFADAGRPRVVLVERKDRGTGSDRHPAGVTADTSRGRDRHRDARLHLQLRPVGRVTGTDDGARGQVGERRDLLPEAHQLHPDRRLGQEGRPLRRLRQRPVLQVRRAAEGELGDRERLAQVGAPPRRRERVRPRGPGRPAAQGGLHPSWWGENVGCNNYASVYDAVLQSHRSMQAEKGSGGGHWKNIKNPAYRVAGVGIWGPRAHTGRHRLLPPVGIRCLRPETGRPCRHGGESKGR